MKIGMIYPHSFIHCRVRIPGTSETTSASSAPRNYATEPSKTWAVLRQSETTGGKHTAGTEWGDF